MKQNFSETSPKSHSNHIYASNRNGLILYSYNSCTTVYVETVGKILGKFKSMFLGVFFGFLSNFGEKFCEEFTKISELPGKNYEENKKFGGNCKILPHSSRETLEKL